MRLRVFVFNRGCAKGACKTWDLVTAINARAVNAISELTRTTEGEVAWEAVESYNPIYFLGSKDAES